MNEVRMVINSMQTNFYQELLLGLPQSTMADRDVWALQIVAQQIDIVSLFALLQEEEKVAHRFLWLLTQVAMIQSESLFEVLPQLLAYRDKISHLNTEASFANFWLIGGVPEQNEAQVIQLLFDWLQSPKTNVTVKSRALFVLVELAKKYPELKNEIRLCLEDQIPKNSDDFKKRAEKVLQEL